MRVEIVFVAGPTAASKTEVAFGLAKSMRAEIVSCDSMLIYKEPAIITSKPEKYMLDEVKHHFINIISVEEPYSVFDYYKHASFQIKELRDRNIPVIVCGGSGLYMKALLDGIFEDSGRDEKLRQELKYDAEQHGNSYLYDKLKEIDSPAASRISVNDLKRIIRALEVYYLSGVPISSMKNKSKGIYDKDSIKIFGLRFKRNVLYERINKRVDEMFDKGAIDEVKELRNKSLSLTAKKIIGINEIGEFLDKKCGLNKAKEVMKKNTRNFAKRQFTWFNKDKRIEWIDMDNLSVPQAIQFIADTVMGGR